MTVLPRRVLILAPFLALAAAGLAALYHVTLSGGAIPSGSVAVAAGETGDVPALSEEERAYLWDIEHHGNVLGRHGFRPLADALARGDRAALLALMADDFTGQTLSEPREVRQSAEGVEVMRLEDAGRPPQVLDRESFAARLLEYRRPFGRPPKIQCSLMALAPAARGEVDGPWEGTCLLRMWGEIVAGRPREVTLSLEYRLPRPAKETYTHGGWLRAATIAQVQVAEASHTLMREVAAERGLNVGVLHDNWKEPAYRTYVVTGGAYLCDYDRDGVLDLLVTDRNRISLYKGLPDGSFTDVTERMGLPTTPMGVLESELVAAFADLDGDGWEDLILGETFYRNEEGKRFVPVRTNLALPANLRAVTVGDYDRDGRVDLYILGPSVGKSGSWLSETAGVSFSNRLWRNKGGWQFEDVTEVTDTGGGGRSTFSAAWLDADNDGWPDLYVINEFGDGVLYVNPGEAGGRFRARSLTAGPCDFGSMGVTCGDIDNDGNIDLFVANMYSKAGKRVIGNLRPDAYPAEVLARMRRFVAGSQLHYNLGGLRFEQRGEAYRVAGVGWSYGAALVDLDNDGFLDLYTTAGFMSRTHDEPDG